MKRRMQVKLIYGRKGSEHNGAILGRVVSKKIYISDRVWKKHFFRLYNGFGISEDKLKTDLKDVDEIQFNTDKGKFRISMEDFLYYGELSVFADRQIICNINKMEKIERHKLTKKEIEEIKNEP